MTPHKVHWALPLLLGTVAIALIGIMVLTNSI